MVEAGGSFEVVRVVYLLQKVSVQVIGIEMEALYTNLLALVFLLLRFRRRTRFFLHFALIFG